MNRQLDQVLEELHAWCMARSVEEAHGKTLEQAGRSSGLARAAKRIREVQYEIVADDVERLKQGLG